MKCPKCGVEITEGILFCRECGAKLDTFQNRVCRECGAALAEGAKFCTECGAKVEIPILVSDETAYNSDSHDAAPEQNMPVSDAPVEKKPHKKEKTGKSNSEGASTAVKTKPVQSKKKKSKTPLIIVAILFLFVAFAISVLGKSAPSNPETSGAVRSSVASEPKIVMVDVVNMTYPAAQNTLRSAGFTNIASNIEPGADESQWVVTKQSASAGRTVKAGDKIQLTCALRCCLYIDVKSEANLMFNTYDIAVNLDGIEIGTVSNGKVFTYLEEILSGEHTLTFSKSGSSSPNATKKFTVTGDMTFSCELAHGSSSIEIKNETRAANIGGASLGVTDVTGMVLSEAMSTLSRTGFSNVREEPYGSIWNRDNWIVVSQSLSAGSVVDKNEFFRLDCISLDDYFSKTYVGKNVNEIQALANASGFTLIFQNSSSGDMDSRVASMTAEQKNDWTATNARQYGGADKTAVVTINNPKEATATPMPTPRPTPTPRPESTKTPSSTKTSASSQESNEIITIENNSEFAALLTADYVDTDKQAKFVKEHRGDTVEFDCSVGVLFQNPKYDTIYDYILVPGDLVNSDIGAVMFYIDDAGIGTFHWDRETRPEYLAYGSKIRIRAKIVTGDDPLYIYLKPVKTWGR